MDFKPDTLVSELSIAQRQLLEIAKALSLNSRLVIMDEPTSSLTLAETDRLMQVDRGSQGEGRQRHLHLAPPQRTHPNAPTAWSCCATARVVGELAKQDITHAAMIRLMIGRDLKSLYVAAGRAARR